jgi:hypothetical protein
MLSTFELESARYPKKDAPECPPFYSIAPGFEKRMTSAASLSRGEDSPPLPHRARSQFNRMRPGFIAALLLLAIRAAYAQPVPGFAVVSVRPSRRAEQELLTLDPKPGAVIRDALRRNLIRRRRRGDEDRSNTDWSGGAGDLSNSGIVLWTSGVHRRSASPCIPGAKLRPARR